VDAHYTFTPAAHPATARMPCHRAARLPLSPPHYYHHRATVRFTCTATQPAVTYLPVFHPIAVLPPPPTLPGLPATQPWLEPAGHGADYMVTGIPGVYMLFRPPMRGTTLPPPALPATRCLRTYLPPPVAMPYGVLPWATVPATTRLPPHARHLNWLLPQQAWCRTYRRLRMPPACSCAVIFYFILAPVPHLRTTCHTCRHTPPLPLPLPPHRPLLVTWFCYCGHLPPLPAVATAHILRPAATLLAFLVATCAPPLCHFTFGLPPYHTLTLPHPTFTWRMAALGRIRNAPPPCQTPHPPNLPRWLVAVLTCPTLFRTCASMDCMTCTHCVPMPTPATPATPLLTALTCLPGTPPGTWLLPAI